MSKDERHKLNEIHESLLKSSAKKVLYDTREVKKIKNKK